MNIIKAKTALAWMAIVAAASASANTTMTVTYFDDSREATVVNLLDGSRLVFGGEPAFDFSNCGSAPGRINVADVKRITFEGKWTGVEGVSKEATSLRLRSNPVEAILSVEGYDGSKPAVVSIYSIAGREALHVENWKGEDINVSHLPTGVYILRINNSTLKFIKK
ncbi:MAG: T9SS type A sorting domain-containing protein [Muribaculaceae bacterium]|nr:T9SS type A sorting domain-containing protein [Muribaculaceae bacterium]